MTWRPILLILFGSVVYHLGQRSIPRDVNPAVATLAAYAVAILLTMATLPLFGREASLAAAWRSLNSSTVMVAAGIVAIEIGFLLAYRAGWELSRAAATANASLAVVLLILGALIYGEPISLTRASGVVLCLCGLWLVTRT